MSNLLSIQSLKGFYPQTTNLTFPKNFLLNQKILNDKNCREKRFMMFSFTILKIVSPFFVGGIIKCTQKKNIFHCSHLCMLQIERGVEFLTIFIFKITWVLKTQMWHILLHYFCPRLYWSTRYEYPENYEEKKVYVSCKVKCLSFFNENSLRISVFVRLLTLYNSALSNIHDFYNK